jgi:hypothetical protein
MFPLAGKKFPTSVEELRGAISDALTDVFALPGDGSGVTISGGALPSIKTVRIDLDDAAVTANKPPPKPIGTGKRAPGPHVDKLELSGQPIKYEQAKLNLKLSAAGLQFDFDRDKRGRPLLVLTDARSGKVDARISKEDLEHLLTEAVTAAAKQQGVTVQDVDLELTSAGKRSVEADVRVKAKKMMMSGVVHVTGRLDIDDELNATVSNLNVEGEGVIGKTAAAFLKGKVKDYDGTTVPLMTFSLGDLTLRDLKIDLKKDLHVTAAFGSA